MTQVFLSSYFRKYDYASQKERTEDGFWRLFQKFLPFILSMITENKESLIRKLGSVLNLKRTIIRYSILLVITFAAIFIIVEGLGLFISSLLPYTNPGIVHMIIGLALLIIAFVYKSVWKI